MATEVKVAPLAHTQIGENEHELNGVMIRVNNIQRGLAANPSYKVSLSDRFAVIERNHYITVEKQPDVTEEKRIVNLVPNDNAATPFTPGAVGATATLSQIPPEAEEEWW